MEFEELNQAYMVLSKKTGRPYLDDADASHVFTTYSKAKAYIEETPNTMLDGPRYYKIKNLSMECYLAGASSVIITYTDSEKTIPLTRRVMGREYSNHTMARLISKIKQTKKKSLLPLFTDERMIVPARVENDGEIPKIFYSVVKVSENETYYVAFTDLNEFKVWSGHVEGWQPMEISYESMWRIAKHHGVFFNPYGNRFILKRDMMEQIPRKGQS